MNFYTALRLVTMCIRVHFRLTIAELLVCRRNSWEPSWSGSWQWSLKNVRLWRWTWNVPMIGSHRSTDKRRPLLRRSVRSVLNLTRSVTVDAVGWWHEEHSARTTTNNAFNGRVSVWTGWAATRQTLIHTHSDLMALINFLHFLWSIASSLGICQVWQSFL